MIESTKSIPMTFPITSHRDGLSSYGNSIRKKCFTRIPAKSVGQYFVKLPVSIQKSDYEQ